MGFCGPICLNPTHLGYYLQVLWLLLLLSGFGDHPECIKSDKRERERERERERDHKLGLQDSLIDFFHYKVLDLVVVAACVYSSLPLKYTSWTYVVCVYLVGTCVF